ncbi:unnamed protein product, partial [Staurois parvus]
MEKSPKGIKLQIRHSYNMSTKVNFISIIYTFKITENKKKASAKVGHPAEFIACTAPFAKLRPASVMDCSQS